MNNIHSSNFNQRENKPLRPLVDFSDLSPAGQERVQKFNELNGRRLRAFAMADRAFQRGDKAMEKQWLDEIAKLETQMEEIA